MTLTVLLCRQAWGNEALKKQLGYNCEYVLFCWKEKVKNKKKSEVLK